MSPRLASALDVGLGLDRLAWVRRERTLFRASPVATTSQSVTASTDHRSPWKPALEALTQVLEREALPAGSTLNVILSNHFVRYALVPWNDMLRDEQERLAFAARTFHSVYGEAAAGWDVRLSHDRYGASAIASAIDKELLDALAAMSTSRSLRLGSVQPYFMSAFNRFRQQLGSHGAFALAEPGKLVVGTYSQNSWRWIGTMRLAAGRDLAAQVQQLLYQGQQWDVSSVAMHTGTSTADYWTTGSALAAYHLLSCPSSIIGPESAMTFAGGA